jgi:hypothetical protein
VAKPRLTVVKRVCEVFLEAENSSAATPVRPLEIELYDSNHKLIYKPFYFVFTQK